MALATLQHPKWGACELVRIEGTDWLVRFASNGRLYRFPPTTRAQFVHVGEGALPQPPAPTQTAPATRGLAVVEHPQLGLGDLLRVEITDWIIRFRGNGRTYRYPPSTRGRLTVIEDFTPQKHFTWDLRKLRAKPPPDPEQLPPPPMPAPPVPGTTEVVKIRPSTTAATMAVSQQSVPAERPGEPAAPRLDRQRALRVIESLRNGLPPIHIEARHLAVGFEGCAQ